MDPKQLALQYKDALNATGAFVVQPDGSVKMADNRGGGFAPPWVWAGAIPPASGNDPQSQALRIKLSTPGSDPSSPWHGMYSEGGPFTKHSSWDSSNNTYDGGIDWGTLLGTIGVGSMFAAPALAGLAGGGGAAAAPTLEASMNAGVGATVAPAAAASVPAVAGAAAAAPSLAKTLTGLAPLGATITNRLMNPSPSGSGVSSIDPALLSRLSQMLDLAQRRATSAQPVHDAAMMMAQRMAPTYGDSPRLNDAIASSTNPIPTGGPSAAMLAAYQKLAGR